MSLKRSRAIHITSVFLVQLLNSIVHHTSHEQPFAGSISAIDVGCTLILLLSLVYLGHEAGQPGLRLWRGALWALLLWIFGVAASCTVMRLVDPASMDATALQHALFALVLLAPIALALGAAGAWQAKRASAR